jgi:hypothetical protein
VAHPRPRSASVVALAAYAMPVGAAQAAAGAGLGAFLSYGEPICESHSSLCADVWKDPGDEYVGHDEPPVLFKSSRPGSGNDVTYTVTLPSDPHKQPNASGAGGTTWIFELRSTFWFGMTMCDS